MRETGQDQLREQVRERYARAAITVLDTGGAASLLWAGERPGQRGCRDVRGIVLWTDGPGGR